MKTRLTMALALAVLAGTVTFVVAGSIKREQSPSAKALPGEPQLPAEQFVTLVRPIYLPRIAGPRIISVPQPGDYENLSDSAEPEFDDDDVAPERPAPPSANRAKPRPATPRWTSRSAPPPSAPPRKILGAAKPIHDGPTPIRPLPRFDAKAETGEKFAPPPAISPSAPPPATLAPSDDAGPPPSQ